MSDQATLSPSIVHMGAVQPGSRVTVRINKNAGVGTLIITGVDLPAGLSLRNLSFPTTFDGGGYDFDIVVDLDAPPRIDGEVAVAFNYGESFAVAPLLAIYAAVLPPSINWATSLDAAYEFKTDEFISRSGKSQRRALRRTPRRTLSYQMTFAGDERAQFRNAIGGWQHRSFLVGDITLAAIAPEGMGALAKSIVIEGAPEWCEDGTDVLVVDKGVAEYRYVLGMATEAEGYSRITFASTSSTIFSPGARVYPARLARVPSSLQGTSLSANVAQYQITFEIVPGSELFRQPGAAPVTHEDTEVFTIKPSWTDSPTLTHEHDYDTLDYGQGLVAYEYPIAFGRRLTKLSFVLPTFEKAHELLDTFYRARGKRGIFYVPSFEADFDLLGPLLATTNTFVTSSGSAAKYLASDTVYKAVAVILRDETIICNRIKTIADLSGTASQVTFEDEWPRGIELDEIDRVSWLLVSSFASDGLTISWLTDQSARAEVTFMSRENEL